MDLSAEMITFCALEATWEELSAPVDNTLQMVPPVQLAHLASSALLVLLLLTAVLVMSQLAA